MKRLILFFFLLTSFLSINAQAVYYYDYKSKTDPEYLAEFSIKIPKKDIYSISCPPFVQITRGISGDYKISFYNFDVAHYAKLTRENTFEVSFAFANGGSNGGSIPWLPFEYYIVKFVIPPYR